MCREVLLRAGLVGRGELVRRDASEGGLAGCCRLSVRMTAGWTSVERLADHRGWRAKIVA